jgi:cell division transport system permease protein
VIRLLAAFRFALVTAGQNFIRNIAVSVAAVFVMCLILLLLGGTLLLTHMSDQVLTAEQQRASNIKIFIQDGVSLASVQHFQQTLASDPRVKSTRFENKEEASQEAVARGLPGAVTTGGGTDAASTLNPYPASVNLDLYNIGDLPSIDSMVKANPIVEKSKDRDTATTYDPKVTDRLNSLVHYFEIGGLAIGVVLAFISVVIIMVTIRTAVAIRQREIEIMKLVGATDWFVRAPFILEGLMSGVIAALAAAGLIALTYKPIIDASKRAVGFFPFTYDPSYMGTLLIVLVLAGAVLGAFGSFLGVRRFLTI